MGASQVLFNMGYTELARGNQERATELLRESLAIGRKLGDKGIVSAAMIGLGVSATLRSEPGEAQTLLKEGLAINVELGNKMDIADDLEAFAGLAGALDEELRAARLWGVAAALRVATGTPWGAAERLLHEPQLAAARFRLDYASWEAAFEEGRAMSFEEAVEYALSEGETVTPLTAVLKQSSAEKPPPTLTRREREVAELVGRGLTSRQIASELHISEHTVDKHVANILRKLNLHSREQVAVQMAKQRSHPF